MNTDDSTSVSRSRGTATAGATATGTTSGSRGRWSRTGGTVSRSRTGDGRPRGAQASLASAARGVASWLWGAGGWLGATVTPAGWLLVLLLAAGVAAGLGAGLVEGWVVAAVAAALLVFSIPFLLGGASYAVRLVLARDRVVAGTDITAELRVRNVSHRFSLPSVIDVPIGAGLIEAPVPFLVGGAQHSEDLVIGARRRGVIRVGPTKVTRGDPVGILRREHSWPQLETIYVHPVTVPLPSTSAGFVQDIEGTPTRTIVDSDLSFHAIREYRPGDSPRHIDWKATAKVVAVTGQLMVRQYEESRRSRVAVVLDTRADSYADEDEFEFAVSAAMSFAVQAIRDGVDVVVVTGDGGAGVESLRALPTRDRRVALDASCEIERRDDAQRLESVTALAAQAYPDVSLAILVTGSVIPSARTRRAAFAFTANVRTALVRVEPGAVPGVARSAEFSRLTIGALEDLPHLVARGALR